MRTGTRNPKGPHLEHEGVRGVHENGRVLLGRGLQAELRICGLGVVCECDAAGKLPVVQNLLVMLSQMNITLGVKLEGALEK